jgi:hypothetical protein
VYDDARKFVPTDKGGKLDMRSFSPEHKKIGDHYIDSYIRPLNKQMVKLIRSKMYLLDSDVLPESFRQFLEHAAHLESVSSLDREGLDIYEKVPWVGYPAQFSKDVKDSLDRLLIQYKNEIQLLQGTRSNNSFNRSAG